MRAAGGEWGVAPLARAVLIYGRVGCRPSRQVKIVVLGLSVFGVAPVQVGVLVLVFFIQFVGVCISVPVHIGTNLGVFAVVAVHIGTELAVPVLPLHIHVLAV